MASHFYVLRAILSLKLFRGIFWLFHRLLCFFRLFSW